MTKIEIIDSAVKIGLGAAITAVATITGTMLRARHERKADVRKRRVDLIERLTGEFEQLHSVSVELYSTYATYLGCPNLLAAEMSWAKARECLVTKTGPALATMHSLEGRLMLIGSQKSVKALTQYRLALANLQSEVRVIGGSEGPLPPRAQWESLGRAVHERRIEFFDSLRSDYEKA